MSLPITRPWRVFVALVVFTLPVISSAKDSEFESIEDAIAYAEEELANGQRPDHVAIVLKYTYADDADEVARIRFYCRGGFQPGKLRPGIARVGFLRVCRQGFTVRVDQKGYNQVNRAVKVEEGKVAVVDDIVLNRVTDEDASEVIGRIWLEGDDDLGGIKVRMGDFETTTDDRGTFRFERVPIGDKYLGARVPGYNHIGQRLKIQSGSRKVTSLKGYMKRTARVRWAYQPEASRDLTNDLESGESVLGDVPNSKIIWANGLTQTRDKYDFRVRQNKDRLILDCPYFHPNSPGYIRLADITFDEVLQAPKVDYPRARMAMREGDIFIFKTRDGEHYGKLEVLEINLGEEGRERALSDLARQRPE